MSVEATIERAPEAVKDTATGLIALIKKHPGGAFVVFSFAILLVLRYRNQIVAMFGKVPFVGTRAVSFAAGAAPTTNAIPGA